MHGPLYGRPTLARDEPDVFRVWEDEAGLHVAWASARPAGRISGELKSDGALRVLRQSTGVVATARTPYVLAFEARQGASQGGELLVAVSGRRLELSLSRDERRVEREHVLLGRDGVEAPTLPLLLERASPTPPPDGSGHHAHPHPHPHGQSPHHHHPHAHPHPPGLGHHHP